jgi:hypothetical protein
MMPYFLLYTAAEKRMVDSGQMNDYGVFMYVSLVAFIISGITYPILAFRLIGRYEKMIHENFAFDEKISLDWLRYSIGGLLVIFLTVALFSVLQHVANIELSFNPDFIYYSEIIAFIFFVGYYGIRHEGVVVDSSPTVSVKKIVNPKIEEVRTIGREDCSEVISKLMELMKSQQPYLDPELSLAKLSHLMQVISICPSWALPTSVVLIRKPHSTEHLISSKESHQQPTFPRSHNKVRLVFPENGTS